MLSDTVELPEAVPASKRRLLIVDDDPSIVKAINDTFTASTLYDCHIAASGDEALDALEAFHPNVVILDAILPGINGFEVCRKIKTGPRTRHIRVVMISGFLDETNRNIVRTCGADDVVLKPFSIQFLRQRIETLMDRKK